MTRALALFAVGWMLALIVGVAALKWRITMLKNDLARTAQAMREVEMELAENHVRLFEILCRRVAPSGAFHQGTGECFCREGGSIRYSVPNWEVDREVDAARVQMAAYAQSAEVWRPAAGDRELSRAFQRRDAPVAASVVGAAIHRSAVLLEER